MRFNFHGVYILRICKFRGFRVFKFADAGYSGVEIFTGEMFADVFRHVVLVPVGVPQALFPRVYHPFSFSAGQVSAIRLLPPSHCALLHSKLCFVLKRRKAAAMPFLAAYLAILAFWVSVMVLSYWPLFIDPMATDTLCNSCSHKRSDLDFFLYSLRH